MAVDQELSEEQLHEVLFMQLVLMFQSSALLSMGKLPNPVTQKIERDLQQAKGAIDMLAMVASKTEGNLSGREKQFLQHVLFELRINYVDEVKKPEPERKAGEEEAREAQPPQEGTAEHEQTAQAEKPTPEQPAAEPQQPAEAKQHAKRPARKGKKG
jgi:hypothetical protein